MPKAWLTSQTWDYSDSDYADPPHWEERWFGDNHWFPRWYHNHIRYGLLHWGPIGWITVSYRRIRHAHGIPRCHDCHRILWPWVVIIADGYGLHCSGCYETKEKRRRDEAQAHAEGRASDGVHR